MAVIAYLYNDSFSHKELGVTVGGLNTDTINSAVNGRWDGQYGNVYATVSDSYDRKNHDHLSAFTGTYSSTLAVSRYGVNLGPAVQKICWGGVGRCERIL